MALTRGNKKLSALTSRMIPSVIREDKPNFEVFVKGFFKYLEKQGNPYDIITHIFEYGDIDETADAYVQYFKNTYTQSIPEAITTDFRFLIKNIKSFYRSKGSEAAFQFLLQFIWNTETSFYYPKVDILKTSDGTWTVPTFIRPKAYPPTDDMVFYLDTKIKGDVSGAEAYVDKLVFRDDPANPGTPIIHFQIVEPSLVGTFVNGEELTIIDANKDITSYTKISIDNISAGESGIVQTAGLWLDRSGFISDKNKLQDNYYYQDFSYVVVSQVSLKFYRETIKDLLHPAGYELFGAVVTPEDAPVSSDLLPQSSAEYLNVYEELFTSPVLLSQDAYMHISEIEETMGIDIHSLRVDVSRQSEVDSGAVSNSFYDNFVTNEDTVAVVMTLADLEKVAVAKAEVRLPGSYGYYELNRENAPYDILFSPCMLDNVPLAAWEDTPDEVMPYVNNNVIASVPNTIAENEQPTPTASQQYGKSLNVAGGGSRSIIATVASPYDIYVNTIDPSTGVQTLEQTLVQGSLPNYGLWDNVLNAAGDTIAVGCATDNRASGGAFWGSVEVWTRSGTTWTIEDIIDNPLAASGTSFGISCALSADGNTLAIGCPGYDGTQSNEGAVYVYTRSGTTWSLEQTVVADTPVASEGLGTFVDLSDDGDRLIAMASQSGNNKTFIFDRSATVWSQNNIISAGDAFYANRISGDGLIIAIGEPSFDGSKGRVFLYEETAATVWTLRDTIIPIRSGSANEGFGRSLDLDTTGNKIVVGALQYDDIGAAMVFERDTATSWLEDRRIDPPETTTSFGTDVAIRDDGTGIMIGDPSNSNNLSFAGSVWMVYFDPTPINTGCSSL